MSKAYGVDCGTMFFQVASQSEGKLNIQTTRNAFVELQESEDIDEVLRQNKWQYVKDEDKYYVIGEDSLRVAKMFPGKVELRRPLQGGVLNKGETKKLLIMNELIESAIGKAPTKDSVVCICVSSDSVDGSPDSTFHKARLQAMFKNLGWNVKVIDEGLAVVLSERPIAMEMTDDGVEVEAPFSGIGLSFGAGRSNCVLAYKGLQIVGMSCARAGDWVDEKVAEQTGTPISQVTSLKEKTLDFGNIDTDDDVQFALDAYYGAMIKYVFENFAHKFSEVKSQFESPLDVVIAGGTSMPKGFCSKVEAVLADMNLPFDIKSVRLSSDPRNSVVKGLLTQALLHSRNIKTEETKTEEVVAE